MRITVPALLVVLVAAGASANPVVYPDNLYIDFGGSNCVWPGLSETISVTVFLAELSAESEDGISSIAFRLERTFQAFLLSSEDLMGGPGEGVVDAEGWVSTAIDGCASPNPWGSIPVARFLYLYLGLSGTLEVQPHQAEGATFVPCGSSEPEFWNYTDMYYQSYGGVNMEPPLGCGSVSPVANASWGSIKALYN